MGSVAAAATFGPQDDLNDDVLLDILGRLSGVNRLATAGTCRRLREIAHGTFAHLAMPVPQPLTTEASTEADDGSAKSASSALYAHVGTRIASMESVCLTLPPRDTGANGSAPQASAAHRRRQHIDHLATSSSSSSSPPPPPTTALDLMVAGILSDRIALRRLRSLHLLQHDRSDLTSCQVSRRAYPTILPSLRFPISPLTLDQQVSYESLALIAASCHNLQDLRLPVLSPKAATALQLLPSTLPFL